MLTHIVCWKYRSTTDEAARAEHRRRLSALEDIIPVIENLTVGADILGLERSYDTGLVATFADVAALAVYTEHPDHLAVAAMGKEIAEHVVSVDIES